MDKYFIKLLLLLCWACSGPANLENFDKAEWENAIIACTNDRMAIKQQLLSQEQRLLKSNQEEIIQLLGKPDRSELDNRSKKVAVYYLEAPNSCPKGKEKPQEMHIRFNSVGLAYEVSFKNQ